MIEKTIKINSLINQSFGKGPNQGYEIRSIKINGLEHWQQWPYYCHIIVSCNGSVIEESTYWPLEKNISQKKR